METMKPEEIEDTYAKVLDNLLFPSHLRDQLIATQTLEKKYQMIQMHKDTVKDKATHNFDVKIKNLVNILNSSKIPEIPILISLRALLTTSDRESLQSFIESDGINMLMRIVGDSLSKTPLTELDAAILYECILCCKMLMNNSLGMEAVVKASRAIEHICRSLIIQWKNLALTVLEILSVSCYFSEQAAYQVIQGLKVLSRSRTEQPFSILTHALTSCSIDIKSSVALLINNIIMGLDSSARLRGMFRNELSALFFSEKYNEILSKVTEDLHLISSAKQSGESVAVKLQTKDNSSSIKEFQTGSIAARWGAYSTQINPFLGTMAGMCLLMEETKILGTLGILMSKTIAKKRWFELTKSELRWYPEESPGANKVGSIQLSTIVGIIATSSNAGLLKETRFGFEIEFNDRTLKLGCESRQEKDLWITALSVVLDQSLLRKISYQMTPVEMTDDTFIKHANMYIKQGEVYWSLLAEDRALIITTLGLDTTNPRIVSDFICSETLAMGCQDAYVNLLQELLLIPPGAESIYFALIEGVKILRSQAQSLYEDKGSISKKWTADDSVVQLLDFKTRQFGNAYTQVSKLALDVITKSSEIRELKALLASANSNSNVLPTPRTISNSKDRRGGSFQLPRSPMLVDYKLDASPSAREAAFQQYHMQSVEGSTAYDDLNTDPHSQFSFVTSTDARMSYSLYQPDYARGGTELVRLNPLFNRPSRSAASNGASAENSNSSPRGTNNFAGTRSADDLSNESGSSQATEFSKPKNKLEKYVKMKTMLPEAAIRHRMAQDGISYTEIDTFFPNTSTDINKSNIGEISIGDKPPIGMVAKQKIIPTKKMKGLFWTKLKPDEISGTIWQNLEEPELSPNTQSLLLDLFSATATVVVNNQQSNTTNTASTSTGVTPQSQIAVNQQQQVNQRNQGLSLFDGRRTQNVLIIIGRMRKKPAEIFDMIVQLDPIQLHAQFTLMLLEICPTAEELVLARSHQVEDLDAVGQLFFFLNSVPRLQRRLQLHESAFSWDGGLVNVQTKLTVLESACEEINLKEGDFKLLLSVVLSFGNFLNAGTARGQAYGIKMETLLRLAAIKATNQAASSGMDYSPSLLHAIVLEIERVKPSALNYPNTWTAVWAAAEVSIKQIDNDILVLRSHIQNASIELEQFVPPMSLESGPEYSEPLKTRLSEFISITQPKLDTLIERTERLKSTLAKTLERFGERLTSGNGIDAADPCKVFFTNLASFSRSFRQAAAEVKKHRDNAKKKAAITIKKNAGATQNVTITAVTSLSSTSISNSQMSAPSQTPTERESSSTFPSSSASAPSDTTEEKSTVQISNIFESFHAAQTKPAYLVIAEYKKRIAMRRSIYRVPTLVGLAPDDSDYEDDVLEDIEYSEL